MTKVRIARIGKKASRSAKGVAVQEKRVLGPKGMSVRYFVLDSNDDNFDDELTHVFGLNIDRATQANTAMFGYPDGPRKFAGLYARHRDQSSAIEARHGSTKLTAFRKERGPTFTKARRKDTTPRTLRKEIGARKARKTFQKSK
jgi:hypothetical protein